MTRVLDGDVPVLPAGVDGTVITVGTFDGVHRGHRDVLERLVVRAVADGMPSVLLTFDPHPLEVVNPSIAPLLLTTRREKLSAFAGLGLDYIVVLPFTAVVAQLAADAFVDEILRGRFGMRELLIGHDHGFGRGRAGDLETLRTLGKSRGFEVEVVPPVLMDDGEPVSSTRIRRAIAEGRLAEAREGLGRDYMVAGVVQAGASRGRGLGFPTLNVQPESPRKLLPADGVYAVRVATPRGTFDGMLNLGGRPTFDESDRTVEAHLFDGSGDFYGDVVEVGFVARLRATRRFDAPEALKAQLALDERDARRALTLPAEPG